MSISPLPTLSYLRATMQNPICLNLNSAWQLCDICALAKKTLCSYGAFREFLIRLSVATHTYPRRAQYVPDTSCSPTNSCLTASFQNSLQDEGGNTFAALARLIFYRCLFLLRTRYIDVLGFFRAGSLIEPTFLPEPGLAPPQPLTITPSQSVCHRPSIY